jgi:hypothetical protein
MNRNQKLLNCNDYLSSVFDTTWLVEICICLLVYICFISPNWLICSSTLMIEALCSSKVLVNLYEISLAHPQCPQSLTQKPQTLLSNQYFMHVVKHSLHHFCASKESHKKLVLWLVYMICVAYYLLHTYILYGLFVDTSNSSNYVMLNGSRKVIECWVAWMCEEAVVARFKVQRMFNM